MTLDDLLTPALILDRTVLARNTQRMAARFAGTGVALRPHMKTAKSADVAALATAGQPGGITVSTLAEARYFAERSFDDITYAVGMVPSKLEEAAAIARGVRRLALLTDDARAARALADGAAALDAHFSVLVEVDCGAHRGGVAPESDELMEIARIVDEAPSLALAGVLTHAGHAYHCADVAAVRRVAEAERQAAVRAAGRLRAADRPCPTVSAGSTPTAVHAESFEGLTEFRPGVYMFFDLDQMGLGSCAQEDIAVSVLTSVIGHQRSHDRINVDAGSLALSQDVSAGEFLPDVGYGWVMEPGGRARIADLRVAEVNQEHGMVTGTAPLPFETLPVGSRLRVLPNHACITAAAFACYHVVDGGNEVVAVWDRVNGW